MYKNKFQFFSKYLNLLNTALQAEKYRIGYPGSGYIPLGQYDKQRQMWIPDDDGLPMIDITSLKDVNNKICLRNHGNPWQLPMHYKAHTKEYEIDVIEMLADYFSFGRENISGYITSGGEEGNRACLYWCLKSLLNESQNDLMPILFFSEQTHYSVFKIAKQLGMKFYVIPANKGYGIDVDFLEKQITTLKKSNKNKPIIINANLGTTREGDVDDVFAIRSVFASLGIRNYKIHADAAIYGFFMPFANKNIFDYVDTIAMSTHKLFTLSVAGIAMTTKDIWQKAYKNEYAIGYIGDIEDPTSSGSRSGYAVLEVHNALGQLLENDHEKMHYLYNYCNETSNAYACKLKKMVGNENIHHNYGQFTINFPAPTEDEQKNMLVKKYCLMPLENNELAMHISPHVQFRILDEFMDDYESMFNLVNNKSSAY